MSRRTRQPFIKPIGQFEFIGELPKKPWIPIRDLAIHQVWLSMSSNGENRISEKEFKRRFTNYQARWYYAVREGLIHDQPWHDVLLGKIMDAETKNDGHVKLIARQAALEYILNMRTKDRIQRREKDFGMGLFNKCFAFKAHNAVFSAIIVFARDKKAAMGLLVEELKAQYLIDGLGNIRVLGMREDDLDEDCLEELHNQGEGVAHLVKP